MNTQSNTRFGRKPADIAQDFAEHLKYSEAADVYHTSPVGRYNAIALTIRDRIIQPWETSRRTQRAQDSKRVYYLSLEFLMGRAMTNNIINLGLEKEVREALASIGYTYAFSKRTSVYTMLSYAQDKIKSADSSNKIKAVRAFAGIRHRF